MTDERIRTLIVDDEPLAREGVRLMIEGDDDIEVVGEARDGTSALKAIRALRPALVFLDVQMPGLTGIEVLDQTDAAWMPVVVFVTAYDQYAIQAFERSAIDYVLKPFDDERFAKALQRAKRQVRQRKAGELNRKLMALLDGFRTEGAPAGGVANQGEKWLTRLAIKSAGRIVFLRAEEIDWIGAADYYVELHVGGKAHLLREAMTKLEARLDPAKFLRIHRSAIVNVDRVQEIRASAHGDGAVVLRDGTKLKLSRSHRDKLRAMVKASS
jgi:two-component system LytT family response regulator